MSFDDSCLLLQRPFVHRTMRSAPLAYIRRLLTYRLLFIIQFCAKNSVRPLAHISCVEWSQCGMALDCIPCAHSIQHRTENPTHDHLRSALADSLAHLIDFESLSTSCVDFGNDFLPTKANMTIAREWKEIFVEFRFSDGPTSQDRFDENRWNERKAKTIFLLSFFRCWCCDCVCGFRCRNCRVSHSFIV